MSNTCKTLLRMQQNVRVDIHFAILNRKCLITSGCVRIFFPGRLSTTGRKEEEAEEEKGDSEEEPLKPTDRQAINHKIKNLQDLKEKSEKLKSSIQKEHASRSLKSLGKHQSARLWATLQ